MKENIIKTKSFNLSVKIVELYKQLSQNNEYVLSKQILRSWTSIWANISEAEYSESKMDFIHKFAIAQKETNETIYWLELLFKTNYINKDNYNSLKNKLLEIQKILSSIIMTTKKSIK